MELTSPDFEPGGLIPSRFTCDGENISPNLNISGVPPETGSLVLIVEDPDAPNGTWVHWTVWNIDPAQEKIMAGTVPMESMEGMTSFGSTGYGGPCPPDGTHRYFFKLYALDRTLDLPSSTAASELKKALEGRVLEGSELMGLYSRDGDVL